MKAHPQRHAALETVARLLQRAASLFVITFAFAVLAPLLFAFARSAIRGRDAVTYTLSPESLYPAALGVAGVWCLWLFAAGRKHTVLFLRKFGNTTANEIVSRIVRTSFHGRARLFVLDDSLFRSTAIARRDQLGSLLHVIPFALAIVLFAFNLPATTGVRYSRASSAAAGQKTEYVVGNPLFALPCAPSL